MFRWHLGIDSQDNCPTKKKKTVYFFHPVGERLVRVIVVDSVTFSNNLVNRFIELTVILISSRFVYQADILRHFYCRHRVYRGLSIVQ
jgi:hypothetical protein